MSTPAADAGQVTVRVRGLTRQDLAFTQALHDRALSHGLFGELGPRFLQAYHESFLASPFAIALVVEQDGTPAGFLIGTTANRAHYTWTVRHRGWLLALLGVAGLVRHPRQLIRFVRTRLGRYVRAIGHRLLPGSGQRGTASPYRGEPVAVLTHMAVQEAYRGRRLGRTLVTAFLRRVEATGADHARLLTLGTGDGAAPFYRRLGWEHDHTRTDWDGRPLLSFCHPLEAVDT